MQDPEQVVASLKRTDGCTHVLLITTGSVASIKAPLIVKELLAVRMICFLHAQHWSLKMYAVPECEGGGDLYEGLDGVLRRAGHSRCRL